MERNVWLPVCYSRALESAPKAVKLLGEYLVLWRDDKGAVACAKDLCIHRGVALSLGSVCKGQIVCPYHGWRYDRTGRCSFIPQLEDPCRTPAKARIESYPSQEKFGLVWVCLGDPQYDLPEIPELDAAQWRITETGPFAWNSGSARQVENFTDFAHFPFVHPELLGDPDRPLVPAHAVKRVGNVLHYEIVRPEAQNTDEFPIFANPTQDKPMRHNTYELYLPYTIVLRVRWPGTTKGMLYLFTSQPVNDKECIGYCVIGKNYGDDDSETLRRFEDVIFDQDKRIVESQRPEQVPFDLSEELHLKFDAVAVSYRRAMRELGFKS